MKLRDLQEITSDELRKWVYDYATVIVSGGREEYDQFIGDAKHGWDTSQYLVTLNAKPIDMVLDIPVKLKKLGKLRLNQFTVNDYSALPSTPYFEVWQCKGTNGLADYIIGNKPIKSSVHGLAMLMDDVLRILDATPNFTYKMYVDHRSSFLEISSTSAGKITAWGTIHSPDKLVEFNDVFELQDWLVDKESDDWFA